MNDSILTGANLSNANINGVYFGRKPGKGPERPILCLEYSPNG